VLWYLSAVNRMLLRKLKLSELCFVFTSCRMWHVKVLSCVMHSFHPWLAVVGGGGQGGVLLIVLCELRRYI
jgi:hypothetical protein